MDARAPYFFLGYILPAPTASSGDDPVDGWTRDEIDNLSLVGLPFTVQHFDRAIGRVVGEHVDRAGRKIVHCLIDGTDLRAVWTKMQIHYGGLRDISLQHAFEARVTRDADTLAVLAVEHHKVPRHVSLVDVARRPGCRIFFGVYLADAG
jgi:hypothetical protein